MGYELRFLVKEEVLASFWPFQTATMSGGYLHSARAVHLDRISCRLPANTAAAAAGCAHHACGQPGGVRQ
jgi:hypothetical protein